MYPWWTNERFSNTEDCSCLKAAMLPFWDFHFVKQVYHCKLLQLPCEQGKKRLYKSAPSIMPNASWTPFSRLPECCSCCGHCLVASCDHEGAVHVHSNRKSNSLWLIWSGSLCVVLFLRDVFMVLTRVGQDCFLTTRTLNKLCCYCLIFK